MTWTEFDKYGSMNLLDSTRILFSKSTDRGHSWSQPIQLNKVSGDCIDEDNTVEGAVPCVGPNGEVYVAWAGPAGIRFDRSVDEGQSWLEDDILVDNMPGGWDFQIPGLNRCNGLPFTACDLSRGPYRGTIYINWSDQRNGANNTDIFLSRSTDGGYTWSTPIKVNQDTNQTAHQFLSSMTVDEVTGYVYIVFYDRRNHTGNQTDVYLAFSKDGGQSFQERKISTAPFTPVATMFFGDYTYIAAHGNIIRPVWGRIDAPFQSIWTALIDTATLFSPPTSVSSVKLEAENVWPNPFFETTFISFKVKEESIVSLYVLDIYGRKVATLTENQHMGLGKYTYQFDARSLHLPNGIYYFHLQCNDKVTTRKILYSN